MKNFQVAIVGGKSIPKEKAFPVLKEIKKTIVKAPIKSRQMVISNVADTNSGKIVRLDSDKVLNKVFIPCFG